jgi:hypothetical protein
MMRSKNPEAEKSLTTLAVKLSGSDIFKAIAPGIVYLPNVLIQNVHGQPEPKSLHLCKPAKLVEALTNRKENGGREWDTDAIWNQYCGIIFPYTTDSMFCARCFKEFRGDLYKKLAIIQIASTGKLKI